MKYSDIINVNETFQYSVNIGFDLGNINKLIHYIPTRDSIEILNKYIDALQDKKQRASLLIGAYGKGKSHLMLVLLTLLNDYTHVDEINALLEKIKNIDVELYEKIINYRKNNKKILPVIINPNLGELKQSFLVGIKEALEREEILEINTQTDYDCALDIIDRWKNKYEEAFEKYEKCLNESDITSNELVIKLKECDKEGLEKFKEIYSCVNYGAKFNSLLSNDCESYYQKVGEEIKKYGYTGIFIVFDEFSKFLDNTDESNIGNDMAILQSMAELATRSENDMQIHLTCITHKSIGEYSKNLSQNIKNSFRTVEGRFKEFHFVKNISQTYDMVSKTIQRKEEYKNTLNEVLENKKEFYNDFVQLDLIKEQDLKVVKEECFPLNPLTVDTLVKLSEKIAQNERTLFTFISDNSEYSFKNFIKEENNYGKLLNVNVLYDYFENSFRKEGNEILAIYLRARHAIENLEEENEINIIKSLTVFKMITDTQDEIIDDFKIRLSINLSEEEYNKAVESLVKNGVLKRNKRNNQLDFSTVCTKELYEEINELVNNKFNNINIVDTLTNLYNLEYTIPRKYNDIYRMTRYFSNEFVLDTDLIKGEKLENIIKKTNADGKVIYILKTDVDNDPIKYLENITLDNSMYTVINLKKEIIDSLKEYTAILEIEKNNENYDGVFLQEIAINKDEIKEYVVQYIKREIDKVKEYTVLNSEKTKGKNKNHLASEICSSLYSKTPVINNELINKNNISSQVNKGRINIINAYLESKFLEEYKSTSLEATLYNSTFDILSQTKTDEEILEIIRSEISNSEKIKVSFKNIYEKLKSPPYSLRDGIIPIYLTIVLKEFIEEAVLYFDKKEIELVGENIVKIIIEPARYFIKLEKGTSKKIEYINNIISLFGKEVTADNRKNKDIALNAMKEYILELPRVAREVRVDKVENKDVDRCIIDFRNKISLYDLNKNEFLFELMLKIFKTKDYDSCFESLKEMKTFLDAYPKKAKKYITEKTYELVDKNYKGELFGLFRSWVDRIDKNVLKTILPQQTTELIEYITNSNSGSDDKVINKISNILTNLYIEDYLESSFDEYIENLKNVLESVNKVVDTENTTSNTVKIKIEQGSKVTEKIVEEEEISFMGETLKNNLESCLDEFGESIEHTEKIKILLDLLKDIL